MNILVLGGTGNISYRYVESLSNSDHQVTVISRGSSHSLRRNFDSPNKVQVYGDVNDDLFLSRLVQNHIFDVVVDFICFNGEQASKRANIFNKFVRQYIFISTTAGYSKDPKHLPYTESTPFCSLGWDYVRGKFDAELEFMRRYDKDSFPVTIARLAHTYDTVIPVAVGSSDWTIPQRIIQGKPIVIHGDGTGIWTITHASDVARALKMVTINNFFCGEIVNIVTEDRITWIQLTNKLFEALNKSTQVVYKPAVKINEASKYLGNGVIWHKMWNDFYDSSKLKNYNWFCDIDIDLGFNKTISWYGQDESRKSINKEIDNLIDKIIEND